MVSTTEVKPAALLQQFISCYALREFDTGAYTMPRPMHAVHQFYMTFFLKDQYCDMESADGKSLGKYSNSLTTFFTKSNGCSYWKGNYKVLCIQFKSNGIFAIFGLPQSEMINDIFALEDILGNDSKMLSEKFEACDDIYQMATIINSFLIKKLLLQKHKKYTSLIANVSNNILKQKGTANIEDLYHQSYMSFRNFERRFTDEVGMPPKLYSRITRFCNAIENKMLNPFKSWTDITYENGYYDQAHFIKEVKIFSSKTPDELFKYTPPPSENFMGGLEH